ncbi:MAG: serine/threonine protein kinase [Symploca sp. SIO2E9]|nr:serine/threonine protein kinase [Symploca sp. SIO2E9]
MNVPINLSCFQSQIWQQTKLGQLCGQQKLFHERYEVLRMIGRGGFGVTFLARDVSLPAKPPCVIKQLLPKVSDPHVLEKARSRFQLEAQMLAKLGNHSQIPMLLDYFVAEGEFYLVQEYVRGVHLAKLVRRGGCLSEIALKSFLRNILPLLDFIHNNGVIHRDIKPQNIICCQDDRRLVLIDFGAVKEVIAQTKDKSADTTTTHFVGTVGFAPPEQFSLRPTFGSDIFSLGVTCLYLLTGKAPLEFATNPQTGELQWTDAVELSESLAEILGKMLKVSVNKRYKSARAILAALDLEPHRAQLANCMVANHQPNLDPAATDQERSSFSEFRSPTAKAAIAIREWKQRRREKQQGYRNHIVPSLS